MSQTKHQLFLSMSISICISFSLLVSSLVQADHHNPAPQKAILVTGASSGIGLNITQHLVKQGFYVYAGARKDKDLKRLDAMANVSSVKLDVTKQGEIDAAVKFVKQQRRGLYGIVNNAGVGVFERMSEMSADTVKWMHEINVLGPHRLNLAFLPMLKESKGRTVTIGSISGTLTSAQGGGYSMSKFAVEAYTDSLGRDLAADGIAVGVIKPGNYKSRIREKVAIFSLTGSYDLNQTLTDEQKKVVSEWKERNDALKDPDEVSAAALHFFTADKPRARYLVVPNEREAKITIESGLLRILQSNANQPYEYSRDELIKMMDEVLNAIHPKSNAN